MSDTLAKRIHDEYITKLADNLTNITIDEFFKYIHINYYPEHAVSFMEYFLELTNYDEQFHIHHSKLLDYGIMSAAQSSNVKTRLKELELVKNVDFKLADKEESIKAGRPAKSYLLTPFAFKLCLMRAGKHIGQPIDPTVYAKYYLLLETVFKLYTDYEKLYKDKLLSKKEEYINEQATEIISLKDEIAKLVIYAKDSNDNIHIVRDDLTETKEKVKMSIDYLQEKDTTNHKYYVALSYFTKVTNNSPAIQILKFISGETKCDLDNIINKLDSEIYTIEIESFYHETVIDLRHKVYETFCTYRQNIADVCTKMDKLIDENYNLQLQDQYDAAVRHGMKMNKSLVELNRPIINRFKLDEISAEFTKTQVSYTINSYMSFATIINIIITNIDK
jgi:hypothetical protein